MPQRVKQARSDSPTLADDLGTQIQEDARMRRFTLISAAAIATTAGAFALSPLSAHAVDAGVLGLADVVSSNGGVTFTGHCQYEFAAAGVGGGGATYAVEGAGAAVGVNVRDTQVICTVVKDGISHVFASSFLPLDQAATAGTFSSNSLAAGTTCVEVRAFLSNGAIVSSGQQC